MDVAVQVPKLEGVYSIDDFMGKEAEARHAALKAEKSSAASKKAVKTGPVALGSRSSKHTIDLHAKYQALGIPQPMFNFHGESSRGWSGDVGFPGLDAEELQDIKVDVMYPSKQEAKEELSKLALEILTRLEEQGRIQKVTPDARVRTSKHRVALHDKCQKSGYPQPSFEYAGSNQKGWSAEIAFPGIEFDELNIKDETRFLNKQEAREAVSKLALEALEIAEQEGKLERFGRAKGPATQAPKEKEEPGPNYVGQLLGTSSRLSPNPSSCLTRTRIPPRPIPAPTNLHRLQRRHNIRMPPDPRLAILRLADCHALIQESRAPGSRPLCSRALQGDRRVAHRRRRDQEEEETLHRAV
jgi:hypothetical protein